MKTSEVFRRVRLHLSDTDTGMAHQRYICYALNALYFRGMIGDRDRTRCKRLIRVHLEGKETLEHWLYDNHGIRMEYKTRYFRKIMTTRKAWLTHLIEHYEAKGD